MQITVESLRDKESRDELIDDLIGMLSAGHVPVLLEFVPVSERLPEQKRPDEMALYPVLLNGTSIGMAWWGDTGDDEQQWEECTPIFAKDTITHWAEIHQIEEAS